MPRTGTVSAGYGCRSPTPSSPTSLSPQHHTCPSATSAQGCSAPALTAVAAPGGSGVMIPPLAVLVPSPSWPLSLAPQHATEPSPRSAHVCFVPDAIAVAGAASGISTGTADG